MIITVEEVKEIAGKGYNLIPVFKEVLADLETPVSAFLKLKEKGANLLFESVEGGEKWGRFSIIGIGSYVTVKSKGKYSEINELGKISVKPVETDPLDLLKEVFKRYRPYKTSGLPKVWGGFFGFLSYDAVRFFEPKVNVKPEKEDSFMYDMLFSLPEALLVFDNVKKTITIISYIVIDNSENVELTYLKSLEKLKEIEASLMEGKLPQIEPCNGEGNWNVNFPDDEFKSAVEKAKEYIRAGDIIQVVLSRRFEKSFCGEPINLYRALRFINPSPYMYFLDYNDLKVAGASPEVLVRLEGKKIETRPIAGTRRRGKDEEEDRELERELLSDEKERAEHIMLVDLARNDVGRVSKLGSVEVTELMVIEKYSHVMHIVSNVVGELEDGKDAFDVLRACFPAGTVSGAPKIRAMQIIDEIEPSKRGIYAGAVGYFSFDGDMDTAIAIRTAVIRRDKVYIQAGAGIVADSKPELEAKETVNKAKALFKAVEIAEKGLKQ